jgi:hypothetical protein
MGQKRRNRMIQLPPPTPLPLRGKGRGRGVRSATNQIAQSLIRKPILVPAQLRDPLGSAGGHGDAGRGREGHVRLLMNSYGKTWHTWHTGRHDQPGLGYPLPYGDPMLMWSFNPDGEADEAMMQDRNRRMRIDAANKRAERQDFVATVHPQRGVDLLKGRFPGAAADPPRGVRDVSDVRNPASD